jgi:hypothetical protein
MIKTKRELEGRQACICLEAFSATVSEGGIDDEKGFYSVPLQSDQAEERSDGFLPGLLSGEGCDFKPSLLLRHMAFHTADSGYLSI